MLSILLINDNKIVSRLLQLSSKKSGFDIEESGVFAPQKDSYNLIFVDSDKYSDDLLNKIKENLTYDKLVFIGTAQVKKPDGFELVLEKPFLPTDFTSLVEKNFITEEKNNEEEIIEFDDIENEEVDELLKDDELELDSSPENLAQMVDEIDEIDEEQKTEDNIEDIDTHEEFDIDDNLLLDEEDETSEDSEEEIELPNIDDEIEEVVLEEELKESKTDNIDKQLKSIDKTKMKQLIEPSQEVTKNSEETEEVEEVEELIEEETLLDKSPKKEDNNETNNLEEIVAKKLKEIITPELLQDALKGLNINITFGDKD